MGDTNRKRSPPPIPLSSCIYEFYTPGHKRWCEAMKMNKIKQKIGDQSQLFFKQRCCHLPRQARQDKGQSQDCVTPSLKKGMKEDERTGMNLNYLLFFKKK
eukprot:TRINITY_DN2651_c1_g1_i1.p1 TRINITY_DN2651_c1_g1~~TRINITY_DN2651_c1_g1_i1.p1  ORF type:complete len:101 (-),score=9.05 TRINITY_DN2651_c1_g1_i1:34-336(-)